MPIILSGEVFILEHIKPTVEKIVESPEPKPSDDKGMLLVSDEVMRQLKVIDSWYEPWQREKWTALKISHPYLCEAILSARDKIDEEYKLYAENKSDWGKVESRIMDYSSAWRKLHQEITGIRPK